MMRRCLFIFVAVLIQPALAYAHGGLEAFVLQLAILGYIISAVISLFILRPCPRIVLIIALVFCITSIIIFLLMLYSDWWRFAQSALFKLIFCVPLAAIVTRLVFQSNRKSNGINPSEK